MQAQSKGSVLQKCTNISKMRATQEKLNSRSMLRIAYIVNAAQSRCQKNISIGMFQKEVVVHHTPECEHILEFITIVNEF
jgi:hypothetical protein